MTTYAYDEIGNLTSITYPNNIKTTYAYDSLRRLIHLTTENLVTQALLAEYFYTYDQAGRRSHVALLDGAVNYEYDALGQLISEEKTSGTNQYQLGFEYDPAGYRNWLSRGFQRYPDHRGQWNSRNDQ